MNRSLELRKGGIAAKLTALLGACLVSVSAHALTYTAGTLSTAPYIHAATVTGPAPFPGHWDFTVAVSTAAAGTAVTVNLDLITLGFHIGSPALNLYTSGEAWKDGHTVADPTDVSVSVNKMPTAGSYYFTVEGIPHGAGTDKGNDTFTDAAVLESDTYTLLAGLGLVGFTVYRRHSR